MLVIKVCINYTDIDEIWIQNTGEIKGRKTKYLIRKPANDTPIWHKRVSGYRPLLMKALKVLEDDNE